MKVRFKMATDGFVNEYEGDNITLKRAVELLQRDDVISITVTKQTPSQYHKEYRKQLNKEA